jgi:hypothetical protein
MKEIPLSQGLVALVDDGDFEAVSAHKWSAAKKPHANYAVRSVRRTDGGWTPLYLHTFLTGYELVDHANGNGLDNRRSNLRSATEAENRQNMRRARNNTSGFKGVTWNGRRQKWMAQIQSQGHNRYLGLFTTPEEAAHAYDDAARALFGEFAAVNFPLAEERAA